MTPARSAIAPRVTRAQGSNKVRRILDLGARESSRAQSRPSRDCHIACSRLGRATIPAVGLCLAGECVFRYRGGATRTNRVIGLLVALAVTWACSSAAHQDAPEARCKKSAEVVVGGALTLGWSADRWQERSPGNLGGAVAQVCGQLRLSNAERVESLRRARSDQALTALLGPIRPGAGSLRTSGC